MIRAALLLVLAASPAVARPGVVEVAVTGIRNANGHILVAICDRETFLAPRCAYRGMAPAHLGAVLVQVTGIPAGTYAAEAFHDENDNQVLDRSFFGLPKEGMGFSRDAPIRFGPPNFGDAAIDIPPGGLNITFALRYFD